MSTNAETRAALAAAANTVAGIKCTPYYRESLKPLDACIRLAGRVVGPSRFGWVDTWQVWVALPQDLKAAERKLDDQLIDDLAAALAPEMEVTAITPAELTLGTNTVNGVIFEGAREA